MDDLDRHSESDDIQQFNLTPGKLEKLQPTKDNIKKSGFLTDEKLASIMNFLDEVEVADRLSEIDEDLMKANEALSRPALLVPSGEELAQLEQASVAAAEVTNTMLSQKLQLEEKNRTVHMLQKALVSQLSTTLSSQSLTVAHSTQDSQRLPLTIYIRLKGQATAGSNLWTG